VPLYFTTASALGGYAAGLIVRSNEGRPTKVDGNPDHPASLGATGVFEQLLPMQLFDPHRARSFRRRTEPSSRSGMQEAMSQHAAALSQTGGAGLRFLLEPNRSPLLASLRARIAQKYPRARFFFWDPVGSDSPSAGAQRAFGRPFELSYDLSKADVLVALDDDPLALGPWFLRSARQFAARRVPDSPMNRLYVAEPALTPTGSVADHRLALRASEIGSLARAIARQLGADGASTKLSALKLEEPPGRPWRAWAAAVARDLAAHRGRGLVTIGPRQPPEAHALVHAINAALGNIGPARALNLHPEILHAPVGAEALRSLVQEMRSGQVDTLIITASNPAFSSPADLGFADALAQVPTSIYLGLYEDETAPLCNWLAPAAHLLESWGDAQSPDGTVAIVQPLIAPLFGGVTEAELLASLLGEAGPGAGFSLLQSYWLSRVGTALQASWEQWLSRGIVTGPATERPPEIDWSGVASALREAPTLPSEGLEIVFAPDRKVYDGRFANLSIAQEMPEPITKLAWGNPAWISRATAQRLKLHEGDVVTLSYRGRSVRAPVLTVEGTADDCVVVQLGYGHQAPAMPVAKGVGFNAGLLRTSDAPWFGTGLAIERTGKRERLAILQGSMDTNGRPVVFGFTIDELRQGADLRRQRGPLPKLYDSWRSQGHAWAMSVDLSRCTGCSACVMACQTENNVPAVGKKQVLNRRNMHWLKIDRYFLGPGSTLPTVNQPMLCQHCEYAPCEYVCPVNAALHSEEGLNEQIYNRCVGTRYCSNNCPYKVRRFNFLEYNGHKTALERMPMNPDVTVRARGVMEKCTYCVQRIERARIDARRQGKDIAEGAVVTACQQACPTEAIVFGDLYDPSSRVSKLRGEERRFDVIHEIGTRPRTTYLARLTNPNPELT
jgi:molybdopterin-containing oxidoreductase family iron-sulfur binding subunit